MTSEKPFDPVELARRVTRLAGTAGFATLGPEGAPFVSFVTVATDPAGHPLLLLSRLAVHTANILRDARASLLLVAPGGEEGDPLAGARVTVEGRALPVEDKALAARRFLARHAEARGYAGFADFAYYRLVVERAHLVAGFGRIHTIDASDLLVPPGLADLSEMEESAVAHMNEDHRDAIALYATHHLGEPAGEWRLTGLDALGLDLRCGPRAARLDFEVPLANPGELRPVLVELARQARGSHADES